MPDRRRRTHLGRAEADLDLFEVAEDEPVSADRVDTATAPPEPPAPPGPPESEPPPTDAVGGGHPPRRTPRRLIAVSALAVAALVAVTFWYASRRTVQPVTVAGKQVVNADDALTQALTQAQRQVAMRHGVASPDAQCYFTRPPGRGAGSEIDGHVLCGPVLFVDGDPNAEYLDFKPAVQPADGKSVRLVVTGLSLVNPAPGPIRGSTIRPDGKRPPVGDAGLQAPHPPPMAHNSVIVGVEPTTQLPVPLDPPPTMGGRSGTFTVAASSYVDRVGSGDAARVAAPGQTLLAFELDSQGVVDTYADGNIPPDTIGLTIDGGPLMPIVSDSPQTYVAASIPVGSSSVNLVLTGDGLTQMISVTDGRLSPSNAAVLARNNRLADLGGTTHRVRAQVSSGGATNSTDLTITARSAALGYTGADGTHAPPGTGLLNVFVTYSAAEFGEGNNYAFRPSALTLRLPDGSALPAHEATNGAGVVEYFIVPAGFTTGTVVVAGTDDSGNGWSMTLSTPTEIPVEIPAG